MRVTLIAYQIIIQSNNPLDVMVNSFFLVSSYKGFSSCFYEFKGLLSLSLLSFVPFVHFATTKSSVFRHGIYYTVGVLNVLK